MTERRRRRGVRTQACTKQVGGIVRLCVRLNCLSENHLQRREEKHQGGEVRATRVAGRRAVVNRNGASSSTPACSTPAPSWCLTPTPQMLPAAFTPQRVEYDGRNTSESGLLRWPDLAANGPAILCAGPARRHTAQAEPIGRLRQRRPVWRLPGRKNTDSHLAAPRSAAANAASGEAGAACNSHARSSTLQQG